MPELIDNKNIETAKRGASLARRFYKETEYDGTWEESPDELVNWFTLLQDDETISPTTFKNYRRWLAFYVEQSGHQIVGEKIRRIGKKHRAAATKKVNEFVDLDGNEISKTRKTHQSDTAIYAGKISEPQVKKFGRILVGKNVITGRERYSSGVTALSALRCSMMLGLRPVEWRNVRLKDTVNCEHDGRPYNYVIEIENAKLKKHQQEKLSEDEKMRRLVIANFSDADYHFVRAFIKSVPESDQEFEGWYEQIRKTISRAQKSYDKYNPETNDGQITLYSGRHIFASEARREGSDKFQVAALLGHTNTQNQSYYGDISGKLERKFDFTIPKPWPGEAIKIKQSEGQR